MRLMLKGPRLIQSQRRCEEVTDIRSTALMLITPAAAESVGRELPAALTSASQIVAPFFGSVMVILV
jgi:hypothetical protein